MSRLKLIIILGEKEVGKTTLFRKIARLYSCEKGKKIISPIVNYAEELISIKNNFYKLVDTPAWFLSPKTEIKKGIKEQTEELLKKSNLICWVIDRVDEQTILLNRYLKKLKIPLILLFNKTDLEREETAYLYQSLRPKYYFLISAFKEINLEKLVNKITEIVPSTSNNINTKEKKLNLLIFGPPNSGKSMLMNYLLQENRSLTTSIAGTTQEPVIGQWNWKKINFQLIDTAGITKDQKIKKELWNKCDLAWAVIDATLSLTKQILQIINLSEKNNKPLIIIINKCDLITDKKVLKSELTNRLKSLSYCPIIYLSALKGTGINSLMKLLEKIMNKSQKKTNKKELMKLIENMIINYPPNYYHGGKLKIYFAKQESGLIQRFIFFVNNPQWAHFSYQRYMINYLRKHLKLEYLPIKVVLNKS